MTTTTWRMVTASRPVAPPDNPVWMPPAEPTTADGIDQIAIERVIRGSLPPGVLTTPERRHAVEDLYRTGWTQTMIAKRLNASGTTIHETLAAAGLLPPDKYCVVEGCWRARHTTESWGLCRRCYTAELKRVEQPHTAVETAALEAVAA